MIKSNYMNTQNKWQENNAKWFIELQKYILRESVFKSKNFFKKQFSINDFNLFIYKKKGQFIFSTSFVFNFQKSYLHLLNQKNLLQKFNLATKIILLAFTKNEWIFTILFTKVFRFFFI